ncbi:polyphosphate polymerase domain-containing protein [Actinomyces bowdenii]|uniref:Polyphosphate polymerase domain-containing protein n=1 Tax=Actinomyces bowdenii TaxID=131109 RepID=A0A3P1V9N4_9ACTO|nr:polyphosphate polymerase domain-containing protein [Actinomyces bowdenii]RRD30210.1 polyphosphate polymerase domain-containing protein [Actinomyces bowdenii]
MPRHTLRLRTQGMATISLDQLNTDADLLTRIDRKYLIPLPDAQALISTLAPHGRVLQIGRLQAFSYASTYFDTPDLSTYMLSARKRRRSFKVRTRTYLDSDLCFLEVKTQGSREATVKTRLPYSSVDCDRITDDGRAFVTERLSASSILPPHQAAQVAQMLTPVILTHYDRITMHLPGDGARVTVDAYLTWRDIDGRGPGTRAASIGDLIVVETKNPATPSLADRFLWSQGHRPARISKYATGMALLHPGLPANKWHRTLTHELADSRPSTYQARHAA